MFKYIFIISLVLLMFLIVPSVNADPSSRTCIDNSTLQVNSTYEIKVNSNTSIATVSKNIDCPNGCMDILKACRPNMFIQILEVSGITILFFGMMILGSQLSANLPFLDVIMNIILVIFSTLIAVTEIFGSFSGIFYAEAVVFFGVTILFVYQNVWGRD